MPLILLVEPEGRWVERVRDALASEGIRVKAVNEREAALRSVAEEAPDLVLVNFASNGASELVATLGRGRGGPGVVALVPEKFGATATGADEDLRKPFTEQEVRLLVKRQLGAGRGGRRAPVAPAPAGEAVSSRELFADLLEEVEREEGGAVSPAAPAPRAVPPAPRGANTVEAKLEQTLSGLLDKPGRPKEAPAAASTPAGRRDDVDRLLSATLSGLNLATKPKPPSAAPPPRPVPPPAPPVAAAPPAPPPAKATPAPSRPTAPAPAVTAAIPVQKPAATKAPARESAPEMPSLAADFATQRVPILRPAPSSKAEPGREFGPYTLLERVAVGGMAEVWKARRAGVEGFQKLVAIKKILPHLNDSPDFVAMLIDEAKLAAQLTHPNVTQIYDLGKIGEDHYIAMEFVDGKDLRAVLNALRARGETLARPLALLVASRIAGALDYAHHKRDFEGHELGLVHRDVSPQNVLISHDGVIKLCDFGIVKAVSRTHQTQMGALKGKLQYMSPEQAWGRRVDGRSDVFSLGSLLFEMLTGRRVFAGDTEISILESVREGRVPRLADVAPETPAPIQALVGRALERDPEDRFPTAGDMQRELDRLVAASSPVPTEADLASLLRRIFAAAAESAAAPAAASTASGAGSASGVRATKSGTAPGTAAEVSVPVVTAAPSSRPLAARKGLGLWVGVGAAAAVLIAAAVVFTRGSSPPAPPSVARLEESAAAPGADTAAALASPSTATPTLDGKATTAAGASETGTSEPAPAAAPGTPPLAQLVDQEFAKREQALRQQYETEKKRLEEQLRQARAGQTSQPETAAAPVPATAGPSSPAPAPAPPAVPPSTAASEPASEPTASLEPPAAATATADPAIESVPEPAPAPPVEPPVASEPAPRPAVVEVGALVTPGPGVVAPQLVSRLEPRYPAVARSRNASASVTVEVLVDERGQVVQTRLLKGDDRGLGFNEAALAAAQVARFRPATKNGVAVKMWKALVFPFQL